MWVVEPRGTWEGLSFKFVVVVGLFFCISEVLWFAVC